MTPSGTQNELYRAVVPRLAERASSSEPDWLGSIRSAARERFRAFGLPTAKDEAWRFTPLRAVAKIPFSKDATTDHVGQRAAVPALGGLRIDVLNGSPKLDGIAPPRGVRVCRIDEALRKHAALFEPHLARHATTDDGFIALNTALFEDGLAVVVEAGAELAAPIHLVHETVATSGPTVSTPRLIVLLEPGAAGCLVETHVGTPRAPCLSNGVTEIALGSGARLRHVRVVNGSAERFVVAATFVHQSRDSHYDSHDFSFGGALTRHDVAVALAGPGAECSLDGLYLARTGDTVDHHTRVVHESGLAASNQKFKGVLDGSGHGVFDGTVIVRRDAQRTEAHQENRNLLLSNDATVHTKPHLEIDADDVKCSHGATVGRLDPAQLFYLRSRGIDLGTARAALTYAFAAELTERLPNDALRRFLDERVLSWLPEGNLVRGLLA